MSEENKTKCLCGKLTVARPLDDSLFEDCQKCVKCNIEIHDIPTYNLHANHHKIKLTPKENNHEYHGAGSLLSGDEIHKLNEETKMIVAEMSINDLMNYITECKRIEQSMRSKQMIAQMEMNKKLRYQDTARIEECQRLGVNSITEAKEKVSNVITKSINSYRKMGLNDDKILKIMLATTEKSEAEIRKYL